MGCLCLSPNFVEIVVQTEGCRGVRARGDLFVYIILLIKPRWYFLLRVISNKINEGEVAGWGRKGV